MADDTPMPPRDRLCAIDRETLAPVVADSRSWRQVGQAVGLPSSRHCRRLRSLCDQWAIDYSHFRYHHFSDQQLVEALGTASSWAQALTLLGYAEDSGSARATIRKHAKRLGLPTPYFAVRPVSSAAVVCMTPSASNLRNAGPTLVAAACILAGHRVTWPLEPAAYDLVVDTGSSLQRVQVKTCTRKVGGSWQCSVTRSEYAHVAGGKRRAWYSQDDIDAFAIVDGDGEIYWIPIGDVVGQATLSLRRYGEYRVPRFGSAGC